MHESDTKPTKHAGSCHCKAVRFTVLVDAARGSACNCSICMKLGVVTAIVKPEAFELLQGEEQLFTYGGDMGRRHFCRTCGIFCFGRGVLEQAGGPYVSVSLNALDDVDVKDVVLVHWDGRHNNWQAGPRDTPWPVFP